MSVVYLTRTAMTERRAKKLSAMAKLQAKKREEKGQLSVLIDQEVLNRWRAYVKDRREEDDEWTAAAILEDLLDRELRRKKRR
jgi:acyl-CoA reductase-like NAD-dependent aldehyde dehydrogenase